MGQKRLTCSTVVCLLSPAADMPPLGPAPRWAKNGPEQLQQPCDKCISQHLPRTLFVGEVDPRHRIGHELIT
jgi:hypothetical protein